MAYRKLGRTSSQRKAMLRDLTTDLLINESIVTTEARAKEIRKTVEKMITLGKRGDLHARRQVTLSYVMKSHLKTMMKQLISILLLQHFKNCSQKSHLVTQTVTVDTLVSLKLNHVVVMRANGDHRISIKSSILLSVMMMEPCALSLVLVYR